MKKILFESIIDNNIKNKLFEIAGGLYFVTQNPDVASMGESDIIAMLTIKKDSVVVETETSVEEYLLDRISNVYVYRNDSGSVYIMDSCTGVTFTKKLAGAMNYALIKKDDYDAYMEEMLAQEEKAKQQADNQAQDEAFAAANGEEVPVEDGTEMEHVPEEEVYGETPVEEVELVQESYIHIKKKIVLNPNYNKKD